MALSPSRLSLISIWRRRTAMQRKPSPKGQDFALPPPGPRPELASLVSVSLALVYPGWLFLGTTSPQQVQTRTTQTRLRHATMQAVTSEVGEFFEEGSSSPKYLKTYAPLSQAVQP